MTVEFAGTLRERVIIERPAAVRTTMGLRVGGWERVASCMAAIASDGVGTEAEGMALSAMPRFRVVIRTREGIAIDQRLRWRGRSLVIRQLLTNPTQPDRLALRCEEARA